MQFSTLKSARVGLFGFFSAMGLGCVLTVGETGNTSGKTGECEPNSDLVGDECFCDIGYEWCNPDDQDDLTCCPSQGTSDPGTSTDPTNGTTEGTTTDEPTSGTTQDVPTTSGTTDTPSECVVEQAPPASCDPNTENFLCIAASDPSCEVEGSKYYVCQDGQWVENTTDGDESCKADGFDFAFGCEDDGQMVNFVCGVGPGTACDSGAAATCNADTALEECIYGKLTSTDCLTFCMEIGIDGVTYDYGYCGDQGGNTCICCDEGEDNCPLGGTSTGDTSTGGDSSGSSG
jgi:hypothetical protein